MKWLSDSLFKIIELSSINKLIFVVLCLFGVLAWLSKKYLSESRDSSNDCDKIMQEMRKDCNNSIMEMQRLMAQQSSQHISELDSLNRMYFMKQIKIRRELQNIKQRLNEMD